MNRYGQTLIGWGPISAPAIFTGEPQSYSLRNAATKQLITGAAGDNIAMALHSRKGELNFEAKVTSGSTNFLDLSSDNAAISVSTITTGVVICSRAVERWRLLQPKTAAIQATWYPDMTQASPVMAGTTDSAVTPSQTGLTILTPSAAVVYSTYGFTHASGVIHELTLTQQLQITEDDPSPDGLLLGVATHGYERIINLLLLATGSQPAEGSTLALGGGTSQMNNFLIEASGQVMEMEKGIMYSIDATWIPPFGS
jgi:hypothetical protein